MKFKKDDFVRVLHPCCPVHEYGIITDTEPVNTPFGVIYDVDFEDNETQFHPESYLELSKQPVNVGDLVAYVKDFGTQEHTEGYLVSGAFISDNIGEAGVVLEKLANGLCKVISTDFSWEYYIPEDSLFKLSSNARVVGMLEEGDVMYLNYPTDHKFDIKWNSILEDHIGKKCTVIHNAVEDHDFPAYMVEFENGVLQIVYEGWLSKTETVNHAPMHGSMGIEDICDPAEKRNVIKDGNVTYVDLGNGVRMFESGAVRSVNTGKPRFDLISPIAMRWLADYLAVNVGTYGSGNYLHGIPEEICIESLMRHLNDTATALKTGNNDLMNEAIGVLTNAMFLCHTLKLKEMGLYKVSDEFKKLTDGKIREGAAA